MTSGMTFAKTTDGIVALGCFCAEAAYRDELTHAPPGIIDIRAGYAGGTTKSNMKITGSSSSKISTQTPFLKLLKLFWVWPTFSMPMANFATKDTPTYQPFTMATKLRRKLPFIMATAHLKSTETIQTKILPLTTFYDAEEYHQATTKKPMRYNTIDGAANATPG